jgi:hypothetical protein
MRYFPSVLFGFRVVLVRTPQPSLKRGFADDAPEPRSMTGDSPTTLRTLAEQCRCLARGASTGEVARSLQEIAAGYDNLAARADARSKPPAPARD